MARAARGGSEAVARGRRGGAKGGPAIRGREHGTLAGLTEALVAEAMDERTIERGEAYLLGGNVLEAVDLGDALWGRVQGRQFDPYEVTIRIAEDGLSARCSCPMEAMCKHCAALALKWARDPSSFMDGETILSSLRSMGRDALASRLELLLRSDPALIARFRNL
jgi:uncharacterized Zn finger protein